MPFAASTLDRIFGALDLPITPFYVEQVQASLNAAETYGGDAAVARIEGYLDEYDSLYTQLTPGAANASLIRADVLEWQPGGKQSGIQQRIDAVVEKIAKALLIETFAAKPGVRLVRRR